MSGLAGLPSHLGRYELKRLLGLGGLGRVVLGWDSRLRREVAIKLVELDIAHPDSSEELRFMFHREARALAALRHPSILEIYDYSGPHAELAYLVCEMVDAPTLGAVLAEHGLRAPAVVAAFGFELASALGAAHAQHIVHRDIKPENIFWSASGRVVLADFGIAKVLGETSGLGDTVMQRATNIYGSPAFMAPELMRGEAFDHRVDIYAVGLVLYELATGQQAIDGDLEAIVQRVERGPGVTLPTGHGLPDGLASLIQAALARDPAERPTSAAAVAEALRDVLDELEVADPRRILRDHGEPPLPNSPENGQEDEASVELFTQVVPPSAAPKRGLAALAGRGPFVFTMAAVAVALGFGAFMLREMRAPYDRPHGGTLFTTSPSAMPAAVPAEDVLVLVRFPGRATLFVDDRRVGTWEHQVRLALPPGRHSLDLSVEGEPLRHRDILLIVGTEPTFEF